jgi:DNA primase
MISNLDFEEINLMFHADKWLEENYACEFYESGSGFLNCSCPFDDHNDANPSFGLNVEKGFFKCFGCGREGSLIKLVSLLQKVEIAQAIKIIALYENFDLEMIDSFDMKYQKFKKALEHVDESYNKKQRLEKKAISIIKAVMKKDFEKADNMFKKLDILLADNNINSIKEYINEIK